MSNNPHENCINTLELLTAITHTGIKDTFKPKLKPIELTLITYLAMRRNNASFKCYPSQEKIASNLGISKDHVRKTLKALSDKGIIRMTHMYNPKSKRAHSCQYWIMHDIHVAHMAFDQGSDSREYLDTFHDDIVSLYEHEFLVNDGSDFITFND